MRLGTTLIVAFNDSGLVMAADNLGYSRPIMGMIAHESGIQKVFVLEGNIIVGSTGLMRHTGIKYKFEDWISTFIQVHHSAIPNKNPESVARSLENQMRESMHGIEVLLDDEIWKMEPPIKRLVTYVVAGYSDSAIPYIFEFGTELDRDRRKIEFAAAVRYELETIYFFGEHKFLMRAQASSPERDYWLSSVASVNVRPVFHKIPSSLKELTSKIVSLVKVEAHFNPKKVGDGVRVAVIDRSAGRSFETTL